jgi:hypothetical protein
MPGGEAAFDEAVSRLVIAVCARSPRPLAMVEAVSGVYGKRPCTKSREAAWRYSPQSATPHPC